MPATPGRPETPATPGRPETPATPGRPETPPPATRPLGRTGLEVTRLGLGLAALGRPAYITLGREADLGPDRSVTGLRARCHRMLDEAIRLGIRYIDTARSYGDAEVFLAALAA